MSEQEPIIKMVVQDRRNKESIYLQEYRHNVASQNGEDGIIEKIFQIIGFGNRFCIEFGAGDGKKYSNTYNLINKHQFSAVLIESHPGLYKEACARYKNKANVTVINTLVGFDNDNKLDAHLITLENKIPNKVDLLSIDIDGNDIHVWQDITTIKPRVVIIEFNHMIANEVYFLQPRDLTRNLGSSLRATIDVGNTLGYELVATTDSNAIFVEKDLFPLFNIKDNSIDAMYYCGKRPTNLIQGYNGELFLAGLTYHPWKGFSIDRQQIQVLPPNMRKWKFDGHLWPQCKLEE